MAMMLHLPSPTVFTPNSNSKFQRSHFSCQIPSTIITSIQAQPHHLSPSSSSSKTFLSPPLITTKPSSIRSVTARSLSNLPLISPNDHWGTWTTLFAIGAFGIWSERIKIGSTLSGALVSILVGLAASNLGVIANEAPAYSVVLRHCLHVAMDVDSEPGNKLPVLRMATALAVSFAICKTGTFLAKYFGIQGGSLPAITAIVVILAMAFPKQFAYLAPSGKAMALILMQPLCHVHERSYLLQFKESFVMNMSASSDPWAYPKVSSWTLQEGNNSNCCSWAGVECDEFTGHVIGLDLNSSCLHGSINSTSSLFHLVYLQRLNLADNHFNYSQIPSTISNLSKLTYLDLSFSAFTSQIPLEVSQLSKLSTLNLSRNKLELNKSNLRSLVENLTLLEKLDLSGVSIISAMPNNLANLSALTSLSLRNCGLHGFIPSSLGNLKYLNFLRLSKNNFEGHIPSSLGNVIQLSTLALNSNNLTGPIPFELANLTQLTQLFLYYNTIKGQIPFGLMNLTQLTLLNLAGNNLSGQIPSSIIQLKNLEFLDLSMNYFSGTVEFDMFVKLKRLTILHLSYNQVSLLISETSANRTLQKFQQLGLSLCNLSKFPDFLANQDKLEWLELNVNNIHGQVPEWFWKMSKESLRVLSLSYNFLTSLGQHPVLLPWTRLAILDLRSNKLQGSLPIPSFSTLEYHVSNNSLTGKIPELLCNMSSLQHLDLSENNLNGSLPQCLHNFGDSLFILDLRRNKFEGSIPQTWTKGSKLIVINFSQNKFQGWLPKSLAKCTMLKVLDLSNNQFNDTFPFWLGKLPNLKILILRSNKFYGPIRILKAKCEFSSLQIVDLSYNNFTGRLPLILFQNWNSSKFDRVDHLTYIQVESSFIMENSPQSYIWVLKYNYSMTMTNKGVDILYGKVQEIFTALDCSSNRFAGEISESVGNLKGLRLLNISNNILTGHIPLSLGNLAELESLDLSQNKLSGEIPQQLMQLTFLEYFNVSHNHLVGPIPQGKQFNTFQSRSFEGNSKLCGRPLTKTCKNSEALPPSTFEESQDPGSPFQIGWKIVVIGYGFGLVVGAAIGHIVTARNPNWFMKTFGMRRVLRDH